MSNNFQRLKTINKKISFIFELCSNGIVKALQDEKEKQPAIIMHFISIKEQLQKIQDSNDIQILSIFDKEEIRGLSAVRNIASHDYEGLNLEIIESIIRVNLPIIKDKIDNFFACNP